MTQSKNAPTPGRLFHQRIDWRVFLAEWFRAIKREPTQLFTRKVSRECPICGYVGKFINAGMRIDARCPNCASKERDRIIQLYLTRHRIDPRSKVVLHFSPERPFFRRWSGRKEYVSGDIKRNKYATNVVDITSIQFGENTFDLVFCNHILEHVPSDQKGMQECYRVLKPGGSAFFSVPIDESRSETWEPPTDMPKAEAERICGWNHVRLYGRDFPDKLCRVGFSVSEIQIADVDAERYRLRGSGVDKVFVAVKRK